MVPAITYHCNAVPVFYWHDMAMKKLTSHIINHKMIKSTDKHTSLQFFCI